MCTTAVAWESTSSYIPGTWHHILLWLIYKFCCAATNYFAWYWCSSTERRVRGLLLIYCQQVQRHASSRANAACKIDTAKSPTSGLGNTAPIGTCIDTSDLNFDFFFRFHSWCIFIAFINPWKRLKHILDIYQYACTRYGKETENTKEIDRTEWKWSAPFNRFSIYCTALQKPKPEPIPKSFILTTGVQSFTLLRLQSRFGGKVLRIWMVCPRKGTAVPKGF